MLGDAKLPKNIDRVIVVARHTRYVTRCSKNAIAARRSRSISDIELFARAVDNAVPFVAITGSNGKSTVTTLLWIRCAAPIGRNTHWPGGNLGEPALDLLEHDDAPDIYVLELSSFQLQRTAIPWPREVSVLLNITPDHLDWHRDEAEVPCRQVPHVYRRRAMRPSSIADDEERPLRRTEHCERESSVSAARRAREDATIRHT